jgi:signal peptidase II
VGAGRTVAKAALVAVIVVAADQITKAIVRNEIKPGETVDVLPGIDLVHAKNTGVAFSMFSGGGPLVVIVAIVALVALIGFFATHLHRRLVWLPTGLLVGGAAGNLIDRIRSARGVVDFLDVGVGALRWPTFNVADIAVSCGAIALAISLWREDARRPEPESASAA